jgi:hypothetical protein
MKRLPAKKLVTTNKFPLSSSFDHICGVSDDRSDHLEIHLSLGKTWNALITDPHSLFISAVEHVNESPGRVLSRIGHFCTIARNFLSRMVECWLPWKEGVRSQDIAETVILSKFYLLFCPL